MMTLGFHYLHKKNIYFLNRFCRQTHMTFGSEKIEKKTRFTTAFSDVKFRKISLAIRQFNLLFDYFPIEIGFDI